MVRSAQHVQWFVRYCGARMSERTSKGCALDRCGCLDLESILTAFGAPISEEQAWALCYTTVQCFFDIKDENKSKVSLSTDLTHVILHKDGYVHEETLLPTGTQGKACHLPSFNTSILIHLPKGQLGLSGATCMCWRVASIDYGVSPPRPIATPPSGAAGRGCRRAGQRQGAW